MANEFNVAQANEKREPTKIIVNGVRDFTPITQTMIIETNEMCSLINSLFAQVFHDYVGSAIMLNSAGAAGVAVGMPVYPNPDGVISDIPLNQYYVTIIFKDRGNAPEGSIKNLKNLHEPTNDNSLRGKYLAFAGAANRSKNYEITQDTKEALEEFMMRPRFANLNKDFWNRRVLEYAEPISQGVYDTKYVSHVRVIGLSLDALVAKIFGTKDEDGNRVEYLVTPCVVPQTAVQNSNTLFQVSRLDTNNFTKLTGMMYGGSPLSSSYISVNGR